MRRLVCGLFVSLFALSAARALDLTPHAGVIQGGEGGPIPTFEFTDGKARFNYIPPTGWKSSGGGNTLSFFTPEPNAWMELMVIDKGKSQAQADTAMSDDALQAWAAKFVPRGADKVEFVKLVPGPFPMGTRSTKEFIFNFESAGIPTSISISVVDFSDKQWLLMLVSGTARNFEKTRQQAMSSMFSWSAVE